MQRIGQDHNNKTPVQSSSRGRCCKARKNRRVSAKVRSPRNQFKSAKTGKGRKYLGGSGKMRWRCRSQKEQCSS
eukprot:816495-Pleurochrysis_carterae.AAC.6